MVRRKSQASPWPPPPSSVYVSRSFRRHQLGSPKPHKRQRSAQTLTIIFPGFISSPAPSEPGHAPQPARRALGDSGRGLQATAARPRPVHARALAVACGLSTHVPRATGGAASAGGDGEACGREGSELGPEPRRQRLGMGPALLARGEGRLGAWPRRGPQAMRSWSRGGRKAGVQARS